MNVGLYFGTFNPIHIGHMAIANYIIEFSNLDELWFVVTPRSPFKIKNTLLDDYHRLDIVKRACYNFSKFRVTDIEFHLAKPSYTAKTLVSIEEKYPDYNFSLIMGEDNLDGFHKWKNYEWIINNHKLYVYPRPNSKGSVLSNHENVIFVDAPKIEISSTMIRSAIKEGKNMMAFLPGDLWEYVDRQNFYKE